MRGRKRKKIKKKLKKIIPSKEQMRSDQGILFMIAAAIILLGRYLFG